MEYRKILLAVDFTENCDPVIERARDLAQRYSARLDVIHVVENLPMVDASYGPIVPFEVDLTEQLMETGRRRLSELGERFDIPEPQRWLEIGSPKAEIIRVANEQSVDLIIVGSHGRHGISLLLGSTASSVIHHAECDVLAVRLFE